MSSSTQSLLYSSLGIQPFQEEQKTPSSPPPDDFKDLLDRFVKDLQSISGRSTHVPQVRKLIDILQTRADLLERGLIVNTVLLPPEIPKRQETVYPSVRQHRNHSALTCLHAVDPDYKGDDKCELCSISPDTLNGAVHPRMAQYGPNGYGK